MTIYVGDLIRLFGETDWHEVVGTFPHDRFGRYKLSDGRTVTDTNIEEVLEKGR